MMQHHGPAPAPGGALPVATLSLGIAAFVAFVAGGLVAANTMVLTAEHAGLCKDGDAELSVDRGTHSGDRHGVTVHCVGETTNGKMVRRDVGVAALFIGWGVWTAVSFVVLWPGVFFAVRTFSRRPSR